MEKKRKGFDGSVGTGVLHGELQRPESVPCARPDEVQEGERQEAFLNLPYGARSFAGRGLGRRLLPAPRPGSPARAAWVATAPSLDGLPPRPPGRGQLRPPRGPSAQSSPAPRLAGLGARPGPQASAAAAPAAPGPAYLAGSAGASRARPGPVLPPRGPGAAPAPPRPRPRAAAGGGRDMGRRLAAEGG